MPRVEKARVKAIKQREKNYSILIEEKDGENWYSDFGTSKLEKGDIVSFDWEQNGDFRNITKDTLEVPEDKTDQKEAKDYFPPADKYDRNNQSIIIRQCAAKCATRLVQTILPLLWKGGEGHTTDGVMDMMEDFTDKIEKRIILQIKD